MDYTALLSGLGIGGLIGTLLSQWLIDRRERHARSTAFKKQQLEQLYGPLVAMHKEIRARSELRVKLQDAIDTQHARDMIKAGPRNIERASDPHISAIAISIQDENETFKNVLMPRYRDMVGVFRENMWLAEPATREHFPKLVEFVDVWDKVLGDKLPRSIPSVIGHSETNLKPFYAHIEEVHDRLRSEIS